MALDDNLITVVGNLGHATIALTTTPDVETTQIQLYRDRIQAITGNDLFSLVADLDFDGSVDGVVLFEETDACIGQGVYDYYI